MNTKNVKLGNLNVDSEGKFILKVKRDPKKFRLTNLTSFVPYGLMPKDRLKFMTNQGEVDALMIDKVKTSFQPEKSKIDRHNIITLIQHPNVYLVGTSKEDWQKLVKNKLKSPNPLFELTNVDKLESVSYDKEASLIEGRYILYNKENPISKERLIWLCSAFKLSYVSHITEEKRYKQDLVKKLDKFIKVDYNGIDQNKSNLSRFIKAVKEIENTELLFYVRELESMDIVKEYSGIFKVGDRPVGPDVQSVINYYKSNTDIFDVHKKMVLEKNANSILE